MRLSTTLASPTVIAGECFALGAAKEWKPTRRSWMACFALALLFATASGVAAGPIVYASASDVNESPLFGTLDLSTGVFTGAPGSIYYTALTNGPGGLYGSSTRLYTVDPSGVGSQFGTVDTSPAHLWGFASQGASGFYADSRTPGVYTFQHISADGTSMTPLANTVNTNGAATGNLAFGPDGKLYFNAEISGSGILLYTVDLNTGALTQVGPGLGSPHELTLTTAGGVLYGVDTVSEPSPAIYTIDTSTGVATAVGVVSGLPEGFTLDAIAEVPEPATFALSIAGLCAVFACRRLHSPKGSAL